MWRKIPVCCCLAAILLQLQFAELVRAEAGPSILTSDVPLQQFQTRSPLDPRPRLSSSQQTQILSDVQQHREFTYSPGANTEANFESSTPFSSLAKYKVDRKKQTQQIQQQLQSLQSLQSRIQQQQQQINSQLGQSVLQTANPIYQQQFDLKNQYQAFPAGPFNYQTLPPIPLPNIPSELPQTLFNEQQNAQLQEYYEKQRQLEILQRQREQLLLEQQELRRQQELLRLQQQQLRTTLLPAVVPTTLPPLTTTSQVLGHSTTPSGLLLSSPTARKITPSENDIFLRAIATHQKKFTTTTPKPATTISGKGRQERVQDDQAIPKDLLALIQQQQNQAVQQGKPKPQVKVIYQTEKPSTGKAKAAGGGSDKDLLLKQLKIALAQSGGVDDKERNVTTRDIVLPNGKKLQVIHAPNGLPSNLHTTTLKPPKVILDELTKGVGDFEVLRQNTDGKLEEVKTPVQNQPTKKVTFVVLEEQPDGSYKVQGVKGNVDKDAGTDVDSIVERIKKGELKLPPSSKNPTATTLPVRGQTAESSDIKTSSLPTTFRPTMPTTRRPLVSVSPNSVSTKDKYVTSASSISGHVLNSISTTAKPAVTLKYPQYSSSFDANDIFPSTTPASTFLPTRLSSSTSFGTAPAQTTATTARDNLSNLLRKEGLFAMAKYLRQSGLDNVLNETGPYTIFVPTDKAFRTLLVQLGGPEKAEQKFRDNPRLLSGLLLHHVVPGAFKIESLQDEMTGVSLAGTQLRVNVYSMHDHEWNDIKVTTVNGARVAPNKRDVEIPQGLAHAIDRVMFPLPVGDLVQTLQADRERRFGSFLKLLHASGLEEMLSGTKTFTVFAPTDAAFADALTKRSNATPVWQESDGPEAAKEIVLRHVIPTTLYTAGMRYYHQKETLRQSVPLQIQKTGGRIRVNDGHIVTYNVPATNGVLHAIDTVM